MPTSDAATIWPALSVVQSIQPRRILDVGVGFGKTGVLLREYLEIWNDRYDRADWQTRIDGIEPFSPYRNPIWDACYDEVFVGTVQDVLPTLDRYDLVTFLDVIEHLPKHEGRQVVEALLAKTDYLLISTPLHFYAQDVSFDNELERHVSHWEKADFAAWNPTFTKTPLCLVALLSARPYDRRRVRFPSARAVRLAVWRAELAGRGRAWAERRLPAPAVRVLERVWRALP